MSVMMRYPVGLVFVVVLLGGCAMTPEQDLDLEQMRIEMRRAEADETIARFAPAELDAARQALRQLETETDDDPEVRGHLAYMAERRLDVARVRASEREERQRLTTLEREHDQMLLRASLAEAEAARREAERLRLQNLARTEETERALSEAQAARQYSAESDREADLARQEAAQAQRLAQAQGREAELARREAEIAAAQAQTLRRQLENLKAQQTDRGLVFTLGDVLFETGQANLLPQSLDNLDELIGELERYPERQINIEGHTDSRGSDDFNLDLSQRRAEAVKAAIVDRGIAAPRVKAIGLGEEFPVADNDSEFGRKQNRRVEIIVLKPDA